MESMLRVPHPSIALMRMFTCASALRQYEQVFRSDGRANDSTYRQIYTARDLSGYMGASAAYKLVSP